MAHQIQWREPKTETPDTCSARASAGESEKPVVKRERKKETIFVAREISLSEKSKVINTE